MDHLSRLAALVLVVLASLLGPAAAPAAKHTAKEQPPPRTALIILENHEYDQMVGSSEMPYLNSLIPNGTLFMNYRGVAHPSLPNYLALIGGSTYGITTDCTDCWASGTNLAVQLSKAHISWRAYMEDMPEPCYPGATHGGYAKKHNPFMYFESIAMVPNRCKNDVPMTWLKRDMRSKSGLRTFSWLTPNLCNDAHDCSLATADAWLSQVVPNVTKKLGREGILIITMDEGFGAGLHIVTLFTGPGARRGLQSGGSFNHYSLLATIERRYRLRRINAAATAPLMNAGIAKRHTKKRRRRRRHGQQSALR